MKMWSSCRQEELKAPAPRKARGKCFPLCVQLGAALLLQPLPGWESCRTPLLPKCLHALSPQEGPAGSELLVSVRYTNQNTIKTQARSAVIGLCITFSFMRKQQLCDPTQYWTIRCPASSSISFQISLACPLVSWDFPPTPVALAIHLQTSPDSAHARAESWHLINKVSLRRQNSLMKMTLMKDVCFYCHYHRGLRPQGERGAAALYALQGCDLETDRIMP